MKQFGFLNAIDHFLKQKLPFLLCGGSFTTGQPPVLRVSLWTECSLIRAVLLLNMVPELLCISCTKSKCISRVGLTINQADLKLQVMIGKNFVWLFFKTW